MTVTGPVPVMEMGVTLSHEHILVDLIGANEVNPDRYDPREVFDQVLPHLLRYREEGGRTLVECTPVFIGRDAELLRELSRASGVYILTNTGLYGAVDNKYLPSQALEESVEMLTNHWLFEWGAGVDGTGILPGFIKLGVDRGSLSAIHERLIRAGARVHKRTGLTIVVHTGDGEAAREQVQILGEEGVDLSAWIWVHAQNGSPAERLRTAERGGWVSLDGVNPGNLDFYVRELVAFREHRLLHRVLLSHDDGWVVLDGPPGENLGLLQNGNELPYRTIFDALIPRLREARFQDPELLQLLVHNPREAFAIRVRLS